MAKIWEFEIKEESGTEAKFTVDSNGDWHDNGGSVHVMDIFKKPDTMSTFSTRIPQIVDLMNINTIKKLTVKEKEL